MNTRRSPLTSRSPLALVGGQGYYFSRPVPAAEFGTLDPALRDVVLRYAGARIFELARMVLCTTHHSLPQPAVPHAPHAFARRREWLGELCRIAEQLLSRVYAEALPEGRPALIEDPGVIRRILEHLKLWAPLATERGPPLDAARWPRHVNLPLIYHAVPDIA